MKIKGTLHEDYLRPLMFGLQDGIVSTTGVVVGISTGINNKEVIILAALVAVTVEASSMAVGQYSSEKAVHQMGKKEKHIDNLYTGALIMFVAYIVGGAFSIVPTIIFNQPIARILAITSSFTGLFVIGYLKGYLVKHKPLRSAIELLTIGSIATIIGVIVGYLLKV